jgi:gamma-glutamyl-gamma-aminobutyrate hydrolase PuuD
MSVNILTVFRHGDGGKKDLEILSKLPGVAQVVQADFHFQPDDLSFFENLPDQHKEYYAKQGLDYTKTTGQNLEQTVERYLKGVDAIYIPGAAFDPSENYRLDPTDYKPKESPDPRREQFELALIQKARERGIPVLAVCAGSWRLANAFGGKTVALSPDETKIHDQWERLRENVHDISVQPDTYLDAVRREAQRYEAKPTPKGSPLPLQKELQKTSNPTKDNNVKLVVNSTHWRAVHHVNGEVTGAPELQVSATDGSNIAEAIEPKYPGHAPMIGVQFHPEYIIPARITSDKTIEINPDYPFHKTILDNFVKAAETYHLKQEVMKQIKNTKPNPSKTGDKHNDVPKQRGF